MAFIDLNTSFVDHILRLLGGLQSNLLPALFDLLVGIIVIRLLVRAIRLLLKLTQIQTALRYVITSIAETLLWVLLSITLLQELGLNNIIFFFTGSIAAIGIAMAAGGSTLISDIVAAVFLARDGDFNVGDEVIAGEAPTHGIIERMDARRIRIRDEEGNLHILPNSLVERKEWVVVRRRNELGAVTRAAKTAKRLGSAALEKRPRFGSKVQDDSKNAQ
jgi:small-conductance mechanosensitive channel